MNPHVARHFFKFISGISAVLLAIGFLFYFQVFPPFEFLLAFLKENIAILFSGTIFLLSGVLLWILMAFYIIKKETSKKGDK